MKAIKSIKFDNKNDLYKYMNIKLIGLVTSEDNALSNLCNSAGLLNLLLDNINWVGFYLVEKECLKLGPFIGKPACTTLKIGTGVCGRAVEDDEIKIVEDVNKFETHVACDPESKSEIVLPIKHKGVIVAVLDVDSPMLNRFDSEDALGLTKIVETLSKNIDWDKILRTLDS